MTFTDGVMYVTTKESNRSVKEAIILLNSAGRRVKWAVWAGLTKNSTIVPNWLAGGVR